MSAKPVRSILFVCLGNICRSPLAEGVFAAVLAERGLEKRFVIDSAGTGGWRAGSLPDPRSIAVAASHGVDITGQKARKLTLQDFADFDLLLGMDRSNVEDMLVLSPGSGRAKLYLDYATGRGKEVPDPYYGGADGFENVYRMIRDASERLADRLA